MILFRDRVRLMFKIRFKNRFSFRFRVVGNIFSPIIVKFALGV